MMLASPSPSNIKILLEMLEDELMLMNELKISPDLKILRLNKLDSKIFYKSIFSKFKFYTERDDNQKYFMHN